MGIGFGAVVGLLSSVQNKENCLCDIVPVFLHRYLSLTVSVGGLFVIKQGKPEGNRINTIVIYQLPDRQSCGGLFFQKGIKMNFFKKLLLFSILIPMKAYSIELDDFVYWYPRAVSNTLQSDILPKKAMDCFNDFRNNTWKPSAGFTAYEFGINCMHALFQCDTGMKEDDMYAGCADLAFQLIKEQNKYLKECEQNPDNTVCAPVVGAACETEGRLHTIEHTNAHNAVEYSVSTETIICKDKVWQKLGQDRHFKRDITEKELQEELYNRCFNHQIFRSLGGEKNRYFDCDLHSRKCLIAIEAASKTPTTWWFCCKLFKSGEVAHYDGSKGTNGTIKELQQYLTRKDLCPDQDWLND